MTKLYAYVGPWEIAEKVRGQPAGLQVVSLQVIADWIRETGQAPNDFDLIPATFVVDRSGVFRIADRHSEHVACAEGGKVTSAGEVFFALEGGTIVVDEITNQSTGYCPEPESWPVVAAALDAAGVRHPGDFTTRVIFRLCAKCGERNIVKDDWFVCALCDAELERDWNF